MGNEKTEPSEELRKKAQGVVNGFARGFLTAATKRWGADKTKRVVQALRGVAIAVDDGVQEEQGQGLPPPPEEQLDQAELDEIEQLIVESEKAAEIKDNSKDNKENENV